MVKASSGRGSIKSADPRPRATGWRASALRAPSRGALPRDGVARESRRVDRVWRSRPYKAQLPRHQLAFVAILAMAAIVRLWGLGSQPILFFDSGVYLGEGAFLASAAQRAATALVSPGPANPLERIAQATETGTDAHPPDIAKPGHSILLAVAFLMLGKTALAAGLESALSGIGTVAVTYAIGLRGWGPRVAIPAATLLAISGQHLVYSREAYVEADGLLFAMLASLVYLKAGSTRALMGAGLLWGIAFASNNRLSYLPIVFVIAELARWPGWIGLIRRGAKIGVGFAAPLVAIQGTYLIARAVARATNVPANWPDYVQQAVAFLRMNPPQRWRPDEWPTYFADLALMDGIPVLVLTILGIGLIVWRLRARLRSRDELLLAGSLLVPLALYSVYATGNGGEIRMRHFSLAIPWVMLTAAIALDRLANMVKGREVWAVGSATVALVMLALPRIVALDAAPSGMPAVLEAIGDAPVASTNGPVMAFYVGEDRTNARLRPAFVNFPSDLTNLAQRYPTLVVDMQAELYVGDLTDLYARATPRLVVANGSDAWYLADLLEHFGMRWGDWNDLLAKWNANREVATQLRVYDVSELAPSAG